jgi:hypothetical protein
MTEYVTRTGLAAGIGVSELVLNFEDATPGAILAPTGNIKWIIMAAFPKFNGEDETLTWGVKLLGEAISGDFRLAVGGAGVGAAGTGAGADIQLTAQAIPVDISVTQGKSIRIFALGAGTASVTFDTAITLVFQ